MFIQSSRSQVQDEKAEEALLDAHKRQLAAMLAAKKAKRSKATPAKRSNPAKGLKASRASPPQPLPGNILGISWDDPGFSEENVQRFLKTRNRTCRVKKATKNRVAKASGLEHTEFELRMPDAVYKFVVGKKPLHGARPRRNCPPRVQVDENKVRVPAIENTSDEMDIEENNSMNEGTGLTFSTLVLRPKDAI
ncbi:uncharacterized protein N7515_007689 [Penicillium bovifimosum]|uniref:Uncharacterized protein n=1 Tax=Penicillium bovifimosum TaxID=126998 RepID=A0A9W9KVM3_9EURO|nr:uncharacterized protein N7515_007689 [Penicillium bovifimosum]KAJ5123864.1 hypothetical protein N7515_007689 [Penicillium bovifimosum]